MIRKPNLRLVQRFEPEPLVACPSCHKRLPGHVVDEAWIEVPVGEGWLAAYRVVMKEAAPVIGEIRVFPTGVDRPTAGGWSRNATSVPAGGIPARVLRRLRLTDPIGLFERFVRKWEAEHGAEVTNRVFGRLRPRRSEAPVPKRTGRAGRSDGFYARWAAAYVERLQRGSRHPVSDLVNRPPVTIAGFASSRAPQATVRAIIHEARRRKLLTGAPPGRAGGKLTEKGTRLLAPSAR
ncbi:MAG: hypothetical protein ACRDHS_13935 [Actinomycetota bacterium]